jgi:hypothetical protein
VNAPVIDASRQAHASNLSDELSLKWESLTNPSACVGDADQEFTSPLLTISCQLAVSGELGAKFGDQRARGCEPVLAATRTCE